MVRPFSLIHDSSTLYLASSIAIASITPIIMATTAITVWIDRLMTITFNGLSAKQYKT
jgi:hypothetical protein